MQRITPDIITELGHGQIFVFGSNISGRHGKGAAKTAMRWGAIYGKGDGIQGHTYGIPTKGADVRKSLSIRQIKHYVDEFIEFTQNNLHLTFLVTPIGCGLAGYKEEDIAPLFIEASKLINIYLPKSFWHIINKRRG